MALRDRFEMLFEHNLDGVFFTALDEPIDWRRATDREALLDYAFEHLRVTAVNPAMCEQLGATREQLIGTVPSDRWTQDGHVWRAGMRDLYDKGRLYLITRAPRVDGTWLDVEGEYVCLYDDEGRITGHFGTQRDITEKRRASERLELAMSGGDVGIWELDLKTDVMFFDEAWIRRLGYAVDDPRVRDGQWWAAHVTHPDDLPEIMRNLEAHVAGVAPIYRAEHRVRTARGDTLWLLSTGKVHRDAEGKPARLIGMSVDISEKRKATERLGLLMLSGELGVWDLDLVTNTMASDPAWLRRLGYSPEDPRVTHGTWWARDVIHPEDMPEMRRSLRDHIDKRAPMYRVEHRLRTRDGEWLWMLSTGKVYRDAEGRASRLVGVSLDITEKRRATERLELVLAGGMIGIFDLALATNTMSLDPLWLRRLGYSPGEARISRVGWWESEALHPSDLPEMRRQLEAHVEGKVPEYRVEHRIRTASGQWMWMLSSGQIYRDAQGQPVRLLGVMVDITERKVLQERLFLSERMASLGTLAAGVGHEINNPLTYIVLNLTLIEREVKALLPAESQQKILSMLEQARYGSERVSSIVRDLQALTRVPDERSGLVDINFVLERCLDIADHQIRHRARVIRELAPVPAVRGSEGRIVQLFLNLIVNAAQAIREGAAERHWIRISTKDGDGGRVVVEVADNGSGIPAEVAGRIFDPFFTTKPVGEGSGLGLAICRNIVTALGGDIEVDSTPGVGSTFRVLLPYADVASVIAAQQRPVAPPAHVHAKRVLVIDDEPLVGQLVTKVLAGHAVTAETSAREALARLRAGERFDRILCDVMMPEVSGMDFFDALGEIAPEQRDRVVFLSGGVFTERARAFLDSIPNRRLDKPFGLAALTAALGE